MRPHYCDDSMHLLVTASEWRDERSARLAWTELSGQAKAAWRDAPRGVAPVVVVPDGHPAAGVYITGYSDDVGVVAAAGAAVGCGWLERGGWPLGDSGRHMVQVGGDCHTARAVADQLMHGRTDLAVRIAQAIGSTETGS